MNNLSVEQLRSRLTGEGSASYVVTFDRRPIAGAGALDGLRRMTLAEAVRTKALADRIPKVGRVIDVDTLEEVSV